MLALPMTETEFDSYAIDEAAMAEEARAAAALRHQRSVRGEPAGTTTVSPSGVIPDSPTPGHGDGPAETEANPGREFNPDQFDTYRRVPLAGAARLADMSDLARMPETPNARPDQADARTLLEREWRKIFAEHATYDPRDPFGTALDAARSLTEPDDFAPMASGEAAPSAPQRRSIIDKLLGLTGERYQLWPERAIRDTLALPRDAMIAAQQYVPGRRGEEAELNDPLIERAFDAAGLIMGGTFAGAPRGSLGAGPVRPPRPGSADDAARRLQEWRDATPNKTWDHHYRTAQFRQDELASANERIAREAGTTFINPGIKKRETAEGKPARKGYRGPQDVTDVVRGAHMLERPGQADAVASSLARDFGPDNVIDEGWKKSFGGYLDRKVMVRFADGTIGELQLVESRMLHAKEIAKDLYEERRLLPQNDPRRDELGRAEREVFVAVVNEMSEAWKKVFGRVRSSD
jgi:hypothetical protein